MMDHKVIIISNSFLYGLVAWFACFTAILGADSQQESRLPRIFPDYTGIVIPPNIAPLNFRVEEAGRQYSINIRSKEGKAIQLDSRNNATQIPVKTWNELLKANLGNPLLIEIGVQDENRSWRQYTTITNTIARQEIDGYLAYRLLKPVYHLFGSIGIYQRNLQDFSEKPILQNRSINGYCLNCHTFLNQQTDSFAFHVRTESKLRPMILVRSNEVVRVDKAFGYLSWHPSGKILAFSANKISQFYHTIGENRDLFDAESNLCIYLVDSNKVVTPSAIAQLNWNETWPSWAPDGRYLYYCRAPKTPIEKHREVRYDLVRTSFDPASLKWGEPEILVSAKETSRSAGLPRISPDGRWLLFCMSKYGNFPVWQPSSDLCVMDLQTRKIRRLDINSDQSESWHSWSSNGRWIVFSSKRLDGLFARPHFSYVDEQGTFHKPFVLPQKDPAFYDSYLYTFNLPELIREPVLVKAADLSRAMEKPLKILKPETDVVLEHKEQ